MHKTRWSRSEFLTTLIAIDTWPTISTASLSEDDRLLFDARYDAVRGYCEGLPVKEIARRTGISRTTIPSLVKKCLRYANDGRIYGFRALIPKLRTKDYVRSAPFGKKLPEAQGGMAGALSELLTRYPEINKDLISLIKKTARVINVHEKKLRPKTLHKIFLDYLKEKDANPKEWPFNTKYRGARSIATYMEKVLDSNFASSVETREERPARAHLATGTGKTSLICFDEPYDAVEVDAFDVNALLTVAFNTPEGTETDVLLERLWLLAMVDRRSDAVISYGVVYRSEVSADDVVRVIRKAVGEAWQPRSLSIPGLQYPHGGGLPNAVIPAFRGALWGCLFLDGALAHLADAVRERARTVLGFVINYGPVGHFERRPNVENFFGRISQEIFLRYPSTTGSNPQSGRAGNAEGEAIRLKLRASHAEDLLDVKIAQFNCTESEGTSLLSPLDHLRYFVEQENQHFLIRYAKSSKGSGGMLPLTKLCTVRGGRKSGRRPYVELDRVKYTSPILAQAAGLIGSKIVIEIDEDDYRQVRAYLGSGAELGFLRASGRWGITRHSRQTRIAINGLLSKRLLTVTEYDDPILVYLSYLSQATVSKKGKVSPPSPRDATEATRVSQECGLPLNIGPPNPNSTNRNEIHVTSPGPRSVMGWEGPDLRSILSKRK